MSNEVIMLTARDSRAFIEALLDPEPPSAPLRQAAERYKTILKDR